MDQFQKLYEQLKEQKYPLLYPFKSKRHGVHDIGIIERFLGAAFLDKVGRHAGRLVKRDGFGRQRFLIVE